MSTQLGNGNITFGDGTTLSSANVAWTAVSGVPTALNQFTNNLGNYGGFLTSANVNSAYSGYYAYNEVGYKWLNWNGSQWQIISPNCNCNCNC